MRGGIKIGRLGALLIGFACLALLAGLPVVVSFTSGTDALRGSTVQAGPRDAVVVTIPVRLSDRPDLLFETGLVYDADQARTPVPRTAAHIVVEGAVVTVAAGAAMHLTTAGGGLEEALPSLLEQISSLKFDVLSLRHCTVTFAFQDGKTAFSDLAAEVTADGKGGYTGRGTAVYRGVAVSFDVSWSLPADMPSYRFPVKLSVKSSPLEASIEGRLALADGLRLQGTADVSAPKIWQLARWFGIGPAPGIELGRGHIKGTLDWASGTLTFSRATVSIDGNEGNGALALSTLGTVPAIDGTIAFHTLDLLRYAAAAPTLASLWPIGFSAPEDDAGPPLLTRFNADLRLSASKVNLPYVQTGRAAATVALMNGRLLADIAELELEGGGFSGQVTADLTGPIPRYGMRGRLENVDAGRCLSPLLHRNPLQGRANISLDLNGNGSTAADVLASLSGKIGFGLTEGGRLGLDLRALRYAARRGEVKGWAAAGKGQTALEQLDARMHMHDGIASTELLQARSAGLTINASGKVNVVERILDLNLQFSQAAANDRAVAPDDAMLLTGSWSDPDVRVTPLAQQTAAPQ